MKIAWFVLVFVCLACYSKRNDLRSVREIAAPVLSEPRQVELYEPALVTFTANGLAYRLMPLYSYDLSGIVVGKFDYRYFSFQKLDRIFPVDLCLIWGGNARQKVHCEPTVSFSQDCRWCWAQWRGRVRVNMDELSNNHLLVKDRSLLKVINRISRGDQIMIRGKLVNVEAHDISDPGRSFTWNTSITRSDKAAGACEVILVEDIRILKEANRFYRRAFKVSFWLLAGLTLVLITRHFILPARFDAG